MDDTKAVFFDVDDGPGLLRLGCHFEGFKSHDVIIAWMAMLPGRQVLIRCVDCHGGVEDLVVGRS
jgi:hypothetical protein